MRAVRALSRRVASVERASKPRLSPLVRWFGSFDQFVELHVLPSIESGALARDEMIEIVGALRAWETDGTWDRAVM